MNYVRYKIWFIITFSMAVIAIVIRAIWQIVVIPTSDTMLIFIPLIIALLGVDALIAYTILNPHKLKQIISTLASTLAEQRLPASSSIRQVRLSPPEKMIPCPTKGHRPSLGEWPSKPKIW